MKCGDCLFFDSIASAGMCRRHTPQVVDNTSGGVWPMIRANDWCGEYVWEGQAEADAENLVRLDRANENIRKHGSPGDMGTPLYTKSEPVDGACGVVDEPESPDTVIKKAYRWDGTSDRLCDIHMLEGVKGLYVDGLKLNLLYQNDEIHHHVLVDNWVCQVGRDVRVLVDDEVAELFGVDSVEDSTVITNVDRIRPTSQHS